MTARHIAVFIGEETSAPGYYRYRIWNASHVVSEGRRVTWEMARMMTDDALDRCKR